MPFGSGGGGFGGFGGSFQGFARPSGISLNYNPQQFAQQFQSQAGPSGNLQTQADYFAKLATDRAAAAQQQGPNLSDMRYQMGYMGIPQAEFDQMYNSGRLGPQNQNMGYNGVGYDPRYNQARSFDQYYGGGNM
ncbi:MAG: hypothetical protein ABWZ17_02030 [Candidatus Binatia bacterium]